MTGKPLWPIGVTFFCSMLGALGQGFFKSATDGIVLSNPVSWISNWKLLLGLTFYGVATVLFVIALKFGDLSALYPVIAMSYVWVLLIAVFWFSEKTTPVNWIGVAMIVVGVALAAGVRAG